MKSKINIHKDVTNQIIADLKSGTPPWILPWDMKFCLPTNFTTKASYNGINILILLSRMMKAAYTNSEWMTYRQAQAIGGQVRKGEKGVRCIHVGKYVTEREQARSAQSGDDPRISTYAKYFALFNRDQIDGINSETKIIIPLTDPVKTTIKLVKRSGVEIKSHPTHCFYSPSQDNIHMVPEAAFESSERYYRTVLHELVHWTSHKSRSARSLDSYNTERGRAFEELIAEMGCAFLCAEFGFPTELQHSSYIDSWIKFLTDDDRAIFKAATAASKAASYLSQLISDEPSRS